MEIRIILRVTVLKIVRMSWFPRKLPPLDLLSTEGYDKFIEVIISPAESDIERFTQPIQAHRYSKGTPQRKKKKEKYKTDGKGTRKKAKGEPSVSKDSENADEDSSSSQESEEMEEHVEVQSIPRISIPSATVKPEKKPIKTTTKSKQQPSKGKDKGKSLSHGSKSDKSSDSTVKKADISKSSDIPAVKTDDISVSSDTTVKRTEIRGRMGEKENIPVEIEQQKSQVPVSKKRNSLKDKGKEEHQINVSDTKILKSLDIITKTSEVQGTHSQNVLLSTSTTLEQEVPISKARSFEPTNETDEEVEIRGRERLLSKTSDITAIGDLRYAQSEIDHIPQETALEKERARVTLSKAESFVPSAETDDEVEIKGTESAISKKSIITAIFDQKFAPSEIDHFPQETALEKEQAMASISSESSLGKTKDLDRKEVLETEASKSTDISSKTFESSGSRYLSISINMPNETDLAQQILQTILQREATKDKLYSSSSKRSTSIGSDDVSTEDERLYVFSKFYSKAKKQSLEMWKQKATRRNELRSKLLPGEELQLEKQHKQQEAKDQTEVTSTLLEEPPGSSNENVSDYKNVLDKQKSISKRGSKPKPDDSDEQQRRTSELIKSSSFKKEKVSVPSLDIKISSDLSSVSKVTESLSEETIKPVRLKDSSGFEKKTTEIKKERKKTKHISDTLIRQDISTQKTILDVLVQDISSPRMKPSALKKQTTPTSNVKRDDIEQDISTPSTPRVKPSDLKKQVTSTSTVKRDSVEQDISTPSTPIIEPTDLKKQVISTPSMKSADSIRISKTDIATSRQEHDSLTIRKQSKVKSDSSETSVESSKLKRDSLEIRVESPNQKQDTSKIRKKSKTKKDGSETLIESSELRQDSSETSVESSKQRKDSFKRRKKSEPKEDILETSVETPKEQRDGSKSQKKSKQKEDALEISMGSSKLRLDSSETSVESSKQKRDHLKKRKSEPKDSSETGVQSPKLKRDSSETSVELSKQKRDHLKKRKSEPKDSSESGVQSPKLKRDSSETSVKSSKLRHYSSETIKSRKLGKNISKTSISSEQLKQDSSETSITSLNKTPDSSATSITSYGVKRDSSEAIVKSSKLKRDTEKISTKSSKQTRDISKSDAVHTDSQDEQQDSLKARVKPSFSRHSVPDTITEIDKSYLGTPKEAVRKFPYSSQRTPKDVSRSPYSSQRTPKEDVSRSPYSSQRTPKDEKYKSIYTSRDILTDISKSPYTTRDISTDELVSSTKIILKEFIKKKDVLTGENIKYDYRKQEYLDKEISDSEYSEDDEDMLEIEHVDINDDISAEDTNTTTAAMSISSKTIHRKSIFKAKKKKALAATNAKLLKETRKSRRSSRQIKKHTELPAVDDIKEMNYNDLIQALVIPSSEDDKANIDEQHNPVDYSFYDGHECTRAKMLTKKYIQTKGIYELFHFLTTKLVLDRPERPLDYLIDIVRGISTKRILIHDAFSGARSV